MNDFYLTDKKAVRGLVWLFTVTYMISYITRINYSAIISEMSSSTGISKSMLSMALTGCSVAYGTGQIISGICGDKFSPKKLVLLGLGMASLMNLLIPFCGNAYLMLAVWCVNGFAQAFLWPPIVKLMSTLLSPEDYQYGVVRVSWGSSFGTIIVYLLAPLMITLAGWRSVFIFSAVCGIVMLFVWQNKCADIGVISESGKPAQGRVKMSILFAPFMLMIMLAIILQGMIRDGVTTWMPSYIAETYGLSNVISILTGVVLPIFSILCFHVSAVLYRKKFKNPLMCAAVIYGAGTLAALILCFCTGQNSGMSVLCSALLTGSMHGVNLMLIAMLPPYFKKYGNISTVSGVLNSCTYIGSAISTYGVARLSELFGWNIVLWLWLGITAAGTVICLACVRPWRKME